MASIERLEDFKEDYHYGSGRFSVVDIHKEYTVSIPEPTGFFKGRKKRKAQKAMEELYQSLKQFERKADGMGMQPAGILLESSHAAVDLEKEKDKLKVTVWSRADISDCFDRYHLTLAEVRKEPERMQRIHKARDQVLDMAGTLDYVFVNTPEQKSLKLDVEGKITYFDPWKDRD